MSDRQAAEEVYGHGTWAAFHQKMTAVHPPDPWVDACARGDLAKAQELGVPDDPEVAARGLSEACLYGREAIVRWYWQQRSAREKDLWSCLSDVCHGGEGADDASRIELCEWLCSRGPACPEMASIIFEGACLSGRLEIAQWWWQIRPETDLIDLWLLVCGEGHLKIARWLWDLVGSTVDLQEAWMLAVEGGHLALAQWLWGLGRIDHHAEDDHAWRSATVAGHLETARWVVGLGGVHYEAEDSRV